MTDWRRISKREWMDRAIAAETRVQELEKQLAGLLPAAQVAVSKIEFIPIPTSGTVTDSEYPRR